MTIDDACIHDHTPCGSASSTSYPLAEGGDLRHLGVLHCCVQLRTIGAPNWAQCPAWHVEEYACTDGGSQHMGASYVLSRHTLLRPSRWGGIDVRVDLDQLVLPHLRHTLVAGDTRLQVLQVLPPTVHQVDQRNVHLNYQVLMGTTAPVQHGYTIALQQWHAAAPGAGVYPVLA